MILLWLIFGAVVGDLIARRRGFSVLGGILGGLLLGPFLGLFMLLISSAHKCPHCAESIKKDARICRFCGRDLAAPQATTVW